MSYRSEPEDLAIRLCRNSENGPNGCMNCTCKTDSDGYVHMNIGSMRDGTRRLALAHRVSASIWKGFDLQSSLCVLHKCDNPRCINPDHLFIGTRLVNNRDRHIKGRSGWTVGELNGQHKLTEKQVTEIRHTRNGGSALKQLADEYGVCLSEVSAIVNRRIWKHVQEACSE
jgi:hypothetical protein